MWCRDVQGEKNESFKSETYLRCWRVQQLVHRIRISEEIDWCMLEIMSEERNHCGPYLHSATGLVFPGTSSAPPIQITRPRRSLTKERFARNAVARFVSGPSAMYVIDIAECDSMSFKVRSAADRSVV